MKKINQILVLLTLALLAIVSTSPVTEAQSLVEKPPVITRVPESMHLDKFYKKYMDANGIAITASWRVPDSAMVQAWRILKFMTGDLPKPVLDAMVKKHTRVTVMARYEGTTDVS